MRRPDGWHDIGFANSLKVARLFIGTVILLRLLVVSSCTKSVADPGSGLQMFDDIFVLYKQIS